MRSGVNYNAIMTSDEHTSERQDRRYRTALRRGLTASVVLHLLVVLIFSSERLPPSPFAAAGPQAGDDVAAAGGSMQSVELRIVEPVTIPRPPRPVYVPDIEVAPVEEEQQEVEPVDLAQLPQPGVGRGEAEGDAPGREDATGDGAGGTASEGRFRVVAPNPRGMIWAPPDPPDEAMGRRITVHVFVDERGRVVSDSTRLVPRTGDRDWDRDLVQRANEWTFDPARREGRAVAEWFNYSFILGDG